jgi:uncharacterized OB-fold protein
MSPSFRADVFSTDPLELLGMRCSGCGRTSFPIRESCPSCGEPEALEKVPLSARGELCSWSVVRNAPAGLRTPYTLAYIDLPADGVRVMARLVGIEDVELAVGLPLELTALSVGDTRATDDETTDLQMFAFQPAVEVAR